LKFDGAKNEKRLPNNNAKCVYERDGDDLKYLANKHEYSPEILPQ
jgi:hypothetical protein